jgi:hypothetical protein
LSSPDQKLSLFHQGFDKSSAIRSPYEKSWGTSGLARSPPICGWAARLPTGEIMPPPFWIIRSRRLSMSGERATRPTLRQMAYHVSTGADMTVPGEAVLTEAVDWCQGPGRLEGAPCCSLKGGAVRLPPGRLPDAEQGMSFDEAYALMKSNGG